MVQQSRDAMDRSGDLIREALASVPSRTPEDVEKLTTGLQQHLVGEPKDHDAIVSGADAERYGLPVEQADPKSSRWRAVWRLWTKYLVLGQVRVYEGELASQIGEAE